LSVYVDTHGTGNVDEARLELILPQLMNLKPRGIREHLDLNKPIFARTAAYGHFGREPDAMAASPGRRRTWLTRSSRLFRSPSGLRIASDATATSPACALRARGGGGLWLDRPMSEPHHPDRNRRKL